MTTVSYNLLSVIRLYRWRFYLVTSVIVIFVGGAGYGYLSLCASLPILDGDLTLPGIGTRVMVTRDRFAVPSISAGSGRDAFLALGYITAQDRLFQMDLLRRRSAGKLAEIVGRDAIEMDARHRLWGFEHVAGMIAQRLPSAHKEILQAYADGVNRFLTQVGTLPFEFILLGYRPAPWTIEDSLMIVLGMFEELNFTESEERMLSVMTAALPAEVVAFLTPDTDVFTGKLLGPTDAPRRPLRPVPVAALAAILHSAPTLANQDKLVRAGKGIAGSNAWAVAGTRTRDGRAILANDMHLGIAMPNIWYQCHLRYGKVAIGGVVLPGTPLVVVGANQYLAWGMTNLGADVLDLVRIEVNPDNPNEYRTANGWRPFGIRDERIKLKNGQEMPLTITTTIWGPVATKPLFGKPVAIHWTALDPAAVNVSLIDMQQAETLTQGIAIMNRTGGPPVNIVLADNTGNVAWTLMGQIPVRHGYDGSISLSWIDEASGWQGYIPPEHLPRLINPEIGFVVSANNRMLGQEYPYNIGHAFESGYRAWRISERLQYQNTITEQEMLRVQLDTRSEFYDFYRDLALRVLALKSLRHHQQHETIYNVLKNWDGQADIASQGFGLLSRFREVLAKAVLTPFFTVCRQRDHDFEYFWPHLDAPLQAILTAKHPQLLPEFDRYTDWDAFVLAKLEESAQALLQEYHGDTLRDVNWGRINTTEFQHPMSEGIPGLGYLLNMPGEPLPGCHQCIRYADASDGASERLVISPGHAEDGMLHMPGGQSGHPLSPHYRDQHPYWVKGQAIPFTANAIAHTLRFVPVESRSVLP